MTVGILMACLAVVLLYGIRIRRRQSGRHRLPPGPPGEPLIGHIRSIPTFSPEYTYQQWSKEYESDVIYLEALGQPIVVLNSVQAAVDLLDKRGANYSDRPRFVLFEIMGWKRTLTFLRSGPRFRLHRRLLQKNFSKTSIIRFRPLQELETAVMLKGLTEQPQEWESVIRRFATAVVLRLGFGISISGHDDAFLQVAKDASYALAHGGAPAGTPVDFFPFLRWLPSYFHDRSLKFARAWRWAIEGLHDKPFEAVVRSNSKATSLIQSMLDEKTGQEERGQIPELDHEDIKGAAGAVFAAGQDTTAATLIVFVLNMMLHPEFQRQAQSELDRIIGRNKLPTLEDRSKLPFMGYIVQETLRWCPVSPMGIPHRSLSNDVYKGYFIPAGSFVYANARAMTHDSAVYEDADTFDPSRYTPKSEGGRGEPFPVGQFGFGRRVCVGQHLAEASLWIAAASMLSTMNIRRPVDSDGKDFTPVVGLTNGLTCHPTSFACRIEPRDDQALEIINTRMSELKHVT